jgi:hypothetical protein
MTSSESAVAEKVYQAFNHAKDDVAFYVVSRREQDPPNAVYLETMDEGRFLITVTTAEDAGEYIPFDELPAVIDGTSGITDYMQGVTP